MKLLLGAPGSGKTYQLIEKIKQIKPDKFAFVSFTRRAANEAKSRLRNYYKESELRYVRTIHSLCFELLNLKITQVITWKHFKQFGNEYGYEFTERYSAQEDDIYTFLTDDDIEFKQIQINIAKMNLDMYDNEMYKRYTAYKIKNNLVDYSDMILSCLSGILLPKFDLLCVDEIQDLTPIQLNFINLLCASSKQIIYAGDDNQMIFEWAGVDRKIFMKLAATCDYEILNHNYRIKGKIKNLAHRIIKRQNNPITYINFDYSSVENIEYLCEEPIDFNEKESYLILARNGYLLAKVIQGLNYSGYSWDWLYEDTQLYKIRLSTIHGAKGSEADNVILLTDVSPATYENINNDSEHRVWYVAITRARKKLYVVQPQTDLYYDLN